MPIRICLLFALAAFLPSAASPADRAPQFALPALPPASTFSLPSDGERADALKEVRERLETIEKYLADQPTGSIIRAETRLDLLTAKLQGGKGPRAADVRAVIERLGTGADYLDNPAFLELRQALVHYARTLAPLEDPKIAQVYFDRRGALARDWEALRSGGDEAALDRLRKSYSWCVAHRQADAECRVIRENLDHGNLILTLDQ